MDFLIRELNFFLQQIQEYQEIREDLSKKLQLFKKLSVNYELNHIQYTPDNEFMSTMINSLGLDYFFNKDLWIRFFIQNNTAYEKYYFYGLVGWRFKPPFGALYLIVNTDRFKDILINEFNNSEIVFLKITYPISMIKK